MPQHRDSQTSWDMSGGTSFGHLYRADRVVDLERELAALERELSSTKAALRAATDALISNARAMAAYRAEIDRRTPILPAANKEV